MNCPVLTGFNLNLTTVDPRSAWFPYAMQSSATMHATLALAAAFWCVKMPSLAAAIQGEGLRQKGEAMHHVMTQLTRRDFAPKSITFRLLLASIATLANVEVGNPFYLGANSNSTQADVRGSPQAFYGDFRAADLHLRAVYALVQSGGGTEMIQDDYVLCKCLNW
jgi:hypothetical protein